MEDNLLDIQKRVADTLMQRPHNVLIAGKYYEVPRPTIGTLVLASEMIASLPHFNIENKNIAGNIISAAKDGKNIASVCALLVLGAKNARKKQWLFWGKTRLQRLSKKFFIEATSAEMKIAIERIILGLDLADFFALTTFLNGINLTKPTKVEVKATVSGQS